MSDFSKLYGDDNRTYLVALKSKVSKQQMIDYARKEFRVRADQVAVGYATKSKNDIYYVNTKNGPYWCARRNVTRK